jgi:UDP-N-acetylmuramoyl-L-alanyl-D-glutamate--2,6-diaminopimelate ligase
MRLRQLLERGVIVEGGADNDPLIQALTADSRKVDNGTLFAALAGTRTDGRRFIDQAIANGAASQHGPMKPVPINQSTRSPCLRPVL